MHRWLKYTQTLDVLLFKLPGWPDAGRNPKARTTLETIQEHGALRTCAWTEQEDSLE